MGEFELIRRFFTRPRAQHPDSAKATASRVVLGVGDDCALLQPAPGLQLAVSSDMLVSGRHFFPDVDPRALGHKALAVNLSDLAACGARPLGFTLALALPQADEVWLEGFSQGLFALADAHACPLVGGDTTRGPLTICITIFGEVVPGQALLRSGARDGDDIYVSGSLGDAHLALNALRGQLSLPANLLNAARQRLEWPTPRIQLGLALRGIASAAADISDGLLGDLGHILEQSGVGATIDTSEAIKLIAISSISAGAQALFSIKNQEKQCLQSVLAGGDDYELVFTAPAALRQAVHAAAAASATPVTRLGRIEAAPGLRLVNAAGDTISPQFQSFDHFSER